MKCSVLLAGLLLAGCVVQQTPEPVAVEPAYFTASERFLQNVHIKQADEFGITYEYRDVRIDEIAFLASQYCYEQKGRKAVLFDSQLYKNFSRRATFHCLELQK